MLTHSFLLDASTAPTTNQLVGILITNFVLLFVANYCSYKLTKAYYERRIGWLMVIPVNIFNGILDLALIYAVVLTCGGLAGHDWPNFLNTLAGYVGLGALGYSAGNVFIMLYVIVFIFISLFRVAIEAYLTNMWSKKISKELKDKVKIDVAPTRIPTWWDHILHDNYFQRQEEAKTIAATPEATKVFTNQDKTNAEANASTPHSSSPAKTTHTVKAAGKHQSQKPNVKL